MLNIQKDEHVTAFHGLQNVTKYLLDRGAQVDIKADRGGTALHHASFFGHQGVARLLIEAGANLESTDAFLEHATLLHVSAVSESDHSGMNDLICVFPYSFCTFDIR